MPSPHERKMVQTVRTGFAILEGLKGNNGASVLELCDELGLAKSTVYRHLNTLCEDEYVVKDGDQYFLSFRFLDFGEQVRHRRVEYQLAGEKVAELAEKTDERAQFMVEEYGRAVYVYIETGEHPVRVDPGIGQSVPIHTTAAGKAILAKMSEDRVEEIVERHGLRKLTENSITTRDELFRALETIRSQGYSINNEEVIEGLNAIAVPVVTQSGTPVGALSVSGPTHRFKGERLEHDLAELLLGTANELELNIDAETHKQFLRTT